MIFRARLSFPSFAFGFYATRVVCRRSSLTTANEETWISLNYCKSLHFEDDSSEDAVFVVSTSPLDDPGGIEKWPSSCKNVHKDTFSLYYSFILLSSIGGGVSNVPKLPNSFRYISTGPRGEHVKGWMSYGRVFQMRVKGWMSYGRLLRYIQNRVFNDC